MNPDYEYELPRHLALLAPAERSHHLDISAPLGFEPGHTIVMPPYTVTTTATCSSMVVLWKGDPEEGVASALEPACSSRDGQSDSQLLFQPIAGDEERGGGHRAPRVPARSQPSAQQLQLDVAGTVRDRRAQRLERQLDRFTKGDMFLGQLEVLGGRHRRRGGQAVVQFALGTVDSCQYAVKFFLDAEAFAVEAALYAACFPHIRDMAPPAIATRADGPAAGHAEMREVFARVLPQVDAVYGTGDAALVDPRGRPLPPCIVMERGESLRDWSERAEPDRFTAIAVLSNVSKRLADMHEAGYVHRDLKPANVMLLPRQNRWTIIDFGCVARIGEAAPVCFTLAYAAPEVAQACHERRSVIDVSPALDAWSLGIIALELLTSAPAFDVLADGFDGVIAKLRGKQPLPWEDPGTQGAALRRKLGAFCEPILRLLCREPSQRAAMQTFHADCGHVFAGSKSGKLTS